MVTDSAERTSHASKVKDIRRRNSIGHISADKTTIGHLVGRSLSLVLFNVAFDMDMISKMNFSILKKIF